MSEFLMAHYVQAAVSVSFGLAAIKLLAVSNYDVTVAGTILSTRGWVVTTFAVWILVLPSLLVLGAANAWAYRAAFLEAKIPLGPMLTHLPSLIPALFLGLMFIQDWLAFVFNVVTFIAFVWVDTLFRRRARKSSDAQALPPKEFVSHRGNEIAVSLLPVMLVTLLNATASDRMWLPLESVDTSASKAMAGYVLQIDDTWTTLLQEDTRALLVVKSDTVLTRTVCQSKTTPLPVLRAIAERARPPAPTPDPCEKIAAPSGGSSSS
ncbi:hypothetical protein AB6N24_08720 [Cellulomonas sp. 179-A 4D5 NHS]|uniref:hypothetical protein n=1 Tax=Cellulomonas sp. 179-A 4D5 NHS TaxID=3142378 RepID=UPI0039A1077D